MRIWNPPPEPTTQFLGAAHLRAMSDSELFGWLDTAGGLDELDKRAEVGIGIAIARIDGSYMLSTHLLTEIIRRLSAPKKRSKIKEAVKFAVDAFQDKKI